MRLCSLRERGRGITQLGGVELGGFPQAYQHQSALLPGKHKRFAELRLEVAAGERLPSRTRLVGQIASRRDRHAQNGVGRGCGRNRDSDRFELLDGGRERVGTTSEINGHCTISYTVPSGVAASRETA